MIIISEHFTTETISLPPESILHLAQFYNSVFIDESGRLKLELIGFNFNPTNGAGVECSHLGDEVLNVMRFT